MIIIIIYIKVNILGEDMIVCICNNVKSSTIENAIDNGACNVDQVRDATGAAGCCGKCQFKVNRILQEYVPEEQQETACL